MKSWASIIVCYQRPIVQRSVHIRYDGYCVATTRRVRTGCRVMLRPEMVHIVEAAKTKPGYAERVGKCIGSYQTRSIRRVTSGNVRNDICHSQLEGLMPELMIEVPVTILGQWSRKEGRCRGQLRPVREKKSQVRCSSTYYHNRRRKNAVRLSDCFNFFPPYCLVRGKKMRLLKNVLVNVDHAFY